MADTMASAANEPVNRPPPPPPLPQQQQQQHQGLPSISSLTNGLPLSSAQQRSPDQKSLTDSTRDSGTWPQPHGQSKHNSANSGLHVSTLLNPDDSPSRTSVPSTPLSARVPNSAHSANAPLPSINQGFSEPGNRDSHASIDSRRSSVDSRMHQGFGNLYINNPTSPYESANTSQVSLAASLRRPNGGPPLSPLNGRASIRSHVAPRVAPPILGRTPGQPDPTAAKPTQGYAWAFPDTEHTIPEERRGSDSGDSSLGHGISRTNSLAASSIRSSIFSTDSQMPVGQRRFDDDQTTHHHSMQHRTIQSLQSDANQASSQSVGNYSRTPELRVSHKLAERKRRSEMKDLFEELNKAVPQNGGTKASKWEILTKAIDYIRSCQQAEQQLHSELNRLRHDAEYAHDARKENDLLKREVLAMQSRLQHLEPNNTPHVYGVLTSQLNQPQSHSQTNGTAINLPPLNPPGSSGGHSHSNGYSSGPPPTGAMQGVEYGYHGR